MRGYYRTLILVEVTAKAVDSDDAANSAAAMTFQIQAALEEHPRSFIKVIRVEES